MKHNYVVGLVTGGNLKGSSAMGMFISKYTKIWGEEKWRKNMGRGEGSWYDKREQWRDMMREELTDKKMRKMLSSCFLGILECLLKFSQIKNKINGMHSLRVQIWEAKDLSVLSSSYRYCWGGPVLYNSFLGLILFTETWAIRIFCSWLLKKNYMVLIKFISDLKSDKNAIGFI